MENLKIIKIGGGIINDEEKLQSFLEDFSLLEGKKILIHGGGKTATQLGKKLGIQPNLVEGRRITDAETLKIITMVYAGLINKKIVALLQKNNCNVLGLSGADANILPAKKRKKGKIDYGFVGDIITGKINTKFLTTLIDSAVVPVICPLTHDQKGNLLNTNADTIATEIALSLAEKYKISLVYCFDKEGIIISDKVIPCIDKKSFEKYKTDGMITDGMVPKLTNAFYALENGVKKIVLKHSSKLTQKNIGTTLQP